MITELIGFICVCVVIFVCVITGRKLGNSPGTRPKSAYVAESVSARPPVAEFGPDSPSVRPESILLPEPRIVKNQTHIQFNDAVRQRTFDKKTRKIMGRDKKIRINARDSDTNTFNPLT